MLAHDNLAIGFQVHFVFRVEATQVRLFMEKFSTSGEAKNGLVQGAYANFIQEPLRTYAREEVQKYDGLDVKDNIGPIGDALSKRIHDLTQGTPFVVVSVVVGNIEYPDIVSKAVAAKLATTQLLEQKTTEIEIAKKDAAKRIADAEGVAKSMEIINRQLTTEYLQHEAIEAQKMMVNSPNHTTVYIPVGTNGLPLVKTVP